MDISGSVHSFIVFYQGETAQWRDFHTATAVGHVMYVFGGRCDEGGDIFTNHEIYCNKMAAFDTGTCTWSEPVQSSDNMPVGRRSHSACKYFLLIFCNILLAIVRLVIAFQKNSKVKDRSLDILVHSNLSQILWSDVIK